MGENLNLRKLLIGFGVYAFLSWPILEDVGKKKQFNDQFIKIMLQNYCEIIMRDRFGEQQISSFKIREDKNSDMKPDGYLRSISVLSVINAKGLEPQNAICNATVFLDYVLEKIPPETKITIKISDFSNLPSGNSNIKTEIFTFKELNTIYPMAVGATVILYNQRLSILDFLFLWLEKHGWKSKHQLTHY